MCEEQREECEVICRWSDGTWCYKEDLEEYLTFMSDDFMFHFTTAEEDLLW